MNYEVLSKEQLIEVVRRQDEELDEMQDCLNKAEQEQQDMFNQLTEVSEKFQELKTKISGRRY